MDGNSIDPKIIDELFDFARQIMDSHKIYPYVSFVIKDNKVISRGYNKERETKDVSMQGDVVAIREAQDLLGTGDLSGYTLLSLFEPTILGFDVALWAGIKNFVWCINSENLPNHYNKINYGPLDYQKLNPEINIQNGIRESEVLKFVEESKQNNYYPDNLI